jgi:predicted nuclease with TOPRIM domain
MRTSAITEYFPVFVGSGAMRPHYRHFIITGNDRKRMANTKEYAEKAKEQIDAIAKEIEKLQGKAEKASGAMKVEYSRQMEELREKQALAGERLKRFTEAGGGAMSDLKTGMDEAISDMASALDKARERFKDL